MSEKVFNLAVYRDGGDFEAKDVLLPSDRFELRMVQVLLDKLNSAIEETLEAGDAGVVDGLGEEPVGPLASGE